MIRQLNYITVLLLLLGLCFTTVVSAKVQPDSNLKTDSLKRYSVEELLLKTYNNGNIEIYLSEVSKRKLSDEEKCRYYNILGFRYYFEISNDYKNSLKYLEISNRYAKKSNNHSAERANYNLIALLYAQQNNPKSALHYINLRNKIVPEYKDEFQKLYDAGDDDIIYGMLGNFDKTIKSYKKAVILIEDYISKNKNLSKEKYDELITYKSYKYNNLVLSYNYCKKLDSASYYINKIKLSGLPKQQISQLLWSTEINYLLLSGKVDEAIRLTKDSDLIFKGSGYSAETYKHYFLARAYYMKGLYKESLDECKASMDKIIVNIDFINVEFELYKLGMESAQKLGDDKSYLNFSKLYFTKKKDTDYDTKADFIFKLYNEDQRAEGHKKKSNQKFVLFLVISILGLILLFCYLFYKIYVKDRRKLETESKNLKNNKKPTPEKNGTELLMQVETEMEILRKLDIFESKLQFLSKDTSLSSLATKLDTNFNYLSAIIKKHKGSNFNGYINKLRIDYIVNKLESSPVYLNYKISYLAEECGFTSHTTFARIFSEKMGVSPSKFIENLKNAD